MLRGIFFGGSLLAIMGFPIAALAQQTQSGYYGSHMWGHWHGWFLGPIMFLIFVAIATVIVVLLVRWLNGTRNNTAPPTAMPQEMSPMDILKMRFARGEIDKQEFEERRKVLET